MAAKAASTIRSSSCSSANCLPTYLGMRERFGAGVLPDPVKPHDWRA
jgi:hypothetical protein